MNIKISFTLVLTLFCSTLKAEHSLSFLVSPQYNTYSSDSYFQVPDEFIEKTNHQSDQTLEFTGNAAFNSTNFNYLLSVHNRINDTNSPKTDTSINELYLTHSFGDLELTFGRRIHSWGVGYGFRPLDVIQQYNRQSISRQSDIGKNSLGVEYYSDLSSLSFFWINPMNKVPQNETKEENHQQESLVAKISTSFDNYDFHSLMRVSSENKLQLGAGGVHILNDAIGFHSAILYSQAYEKQIHQLAGETNNLLSTSYPYKTESYEHGFHTLIGINWSSINKHSLIAEYWYTDFAYTKQQWNSHFELAGQQQLLLQQSQHPTAAVHGNIAWSAVATQASILSTHNIMLQWSYDADYWKPTINFLYSPVDKSHMITLSTTRTTKLFNLETGIRHFNGTKDSIYGGLILSNTLYLTISSEY